jgi:hypothetical protein
MSSITLRKANALQLLINEQINNTSISTQVSVGKYDNPVLAVITAGEIFQASLNKTRSLLTVLYSIRQKVADASHAAGISAILSEIAHIDKLTGVLKPLASLSSFAPTEEVLLEAHADLKKDQPQLSSYSSRRDAFTTGAIPQGWILSFLQEVSFLRKRKQALSDQLLELNIKSTIELSGDETETLKKYDLI